MRTTTQLIAWGAGLWLSGAGWPAEQGLVAHYSFDEGTGSVLRDVSGNGNDGSIHGARYVRRGRGYCLEFDGVGEFVDCGDRPALDLREALTIEAWVRPTGRVKGGNQGFSGHRGRKTPRGAL